MELGLHIADFTWSTGPAALGPALAKHVRDAEAAGLRKISVMDHFWQIRSVGPAEREMLEAYATLGFIAAHTERAQLQALVTGVTYREPGLLAKQVSTLNVLSGGRVGLGIGAAWNDEESQGLGFNFPPTAERFERLEEAIQICLQMWSDSEEPFNGKHYQLGRTLNSPQNVSQPHPYLMIGGSGEKKTLRLVAQYADACNISGMAGPAEAGRKLDVLRAHCDTLGREYSEIEKTTMIALDASHTVDDVVAAASGLAEVGFTACYVFARGITDSDSIITLLAEAQAKLS
jgi:F420-dependent oxidoreductase-like protein